MVYNTIREFGWQSRLEHGESQVRHVTSDMSTKRPLDESLYHLDHDELTFFRTHTGIDNDEDLKSHILSIQAKAYDVHESFAALVLMLKPFLARSTDILVSANFPSQSQRNFPFMG